MGLFQNSQDQEGLKTIHDNMFSPVSSKQHSYTLIWGWEENKNVLLTFPILSLFMKATKIKVDFFSH